MKFSLRTGLPPYFISSRDTELLESGITSIGRGNLPSMSTFFESSTMQMNLFELWAKIFL